MGYQDFADGTADRDGGAVSAEGLRSWISRARERKKRLHPRGSAAVLIPFLIRDGVCHVLYEVRASRLRSQPGEICFPGGRIEAGEDPMEAAIREATEELCIDRSRIEIVGALDNTVGPGTVPLYTYIGVLHDYEGTWSRAEVDRVFTLPLEWILTRDPEVYRVKLVRDMPEDFPYESVPGGRDYRWREQFYSVPFYPQVQTELSLFEVPKAQSGTSETGDRAGKVFDPGRIEKSIPEPENSSRAVSGPEDIINNAPDAGSGVEMPVLWGVTARVTHALAVMLREERGEQTTQEE